MKPLLFLLLIALAGCDNERDIKIITSKSYSSDYFSQLPKGICQYYYRHDNDWCNHHATQDSCNKYQIGDTIK